jgi:hypothetical protein
MHDKTAQLSGLSLALAPPVPGIDGNATDAPVGIIHEEILDMTYPAVEHWPAGSRLLPSSIIRLAIPIRVRGKNGVNAHRVQLPNFDRIDDVARITHPAKWSDFLNVDLSIQHTARGADGLVPAFGYAHNRVGSGPIGNVPTGHCTSLHRFSINRYLGIADTRMTQSTPSLASRKSRIVAPPDTLLTR